MTGSEQMERLSFIELTRHEQTSPLPPPLQNPSLLPLSDLQPVVLERLVAEIVYRHDYGDVQFYGRHGQKQYGLDVVSWEPSGEVSLYQVRRYQQLVPRKIRSTIEDYAGAPRLPRYDGPERRFGPRRFVLATSATFEDDTTNVDELRKLRNEYSGDLDLDVWGAEKTSRLLRDAPRLVYAVFGPAWAQAWCGFALPPSEGRPKSYGLVEDPVAALNLDAIEADADAKEGTDPVAAARLYGVVAQGLKDGHFPGHARMLRRRQAQTLAKGQKVQESFQIYWSLSLERLLSGDISPRHSYIHELEKMRASLGEREQAKLDALVGIANWYDQGSELGQLVPALRLLTDTQDPDAAQLSCFALEQAIVDGLFDFDPPYSLVSETPEGTLRLLGELRELAEQATTSDPVIRARLACAVADSGLQRCSPPDEVDAIYTTLVERALAGRYLHANSMVVSRAAYGFATHGAIDRAANLWRKAILTSSEDEYYGDARGAVLSLSILDAESGEIRFDRAQVMSALPRGRRLLAGEHDPQSRRARSRPQREAR